MGRTYSCWMLNCWCITWPVGLKMLKRNFCPFGSWLTVLHFFFLAILATRMFWCQITLTRWIKLLDNSYLMLMFSCVCSSNRFYEEIRDVRQLHNLSRSSSLRYTTPNAGCLVTTEVRHGAFCHTSYLSSINLPPPTSLLPIIWYLLDIRDPWLSFEYPRRHRRGRGLRAASTGLSVFA